MSPSQGLLKTETFDFVIFKEKTKQNSENPCNLDVICAKLQLETEILLRRKCNCVFAFRYFPSGRRCHVNVSSSGRELWTTVNSQVLFLMLPNFSRSMRGCCSQGCLGCCLLVLNASKLIESICTRLIFGASSLLESFYTAWVWRFPPLKSTLHGSETILCSSECVSLRGLFLEG